MKCQFSRFARSFPEAYPYFVWLCPTNRERYTKGTKRSRKKRKKLSFLSLTRRSDPRCGGAILDDSEVAGDRRRASIKLICFAGLAVCGCVGLEKTIIDLGMVRHQCCGTEVGGRLRHLFRRCDGSVVVCGIGVKRNRCTADVCNTQRFAVISDFKKERKRSWSVARHRDELYRGVAHGDLHAVCANHVAFGFASGVVRRFVHRVPVCSAVDKVHARDFVLKQPRAAVMVGVRMREDDVFDLTAIQVELSHAAEDFVLRRIIEQCLEDDDAPVAYDCPRIMNLGAEEIEVVGDLGRFSIPGFSRRRCGWGSARASSCARGGGGGRSRRRRDAEAKKGARPLQAGRILGRPDQTVDRRGNRLRQCAPGACQKEKRGGRPHRAGTGL